MTPNRVTVALEKYGNQIPKDEIYFFTKHLQEASNSCMDEFMSLPIKGKNKTLLFSIFLGGLGIDRFYIGDKGLGAAKLIFRIFVVLMADVAILGTLLSLASSIWCIADIFITYKVAKQINYNSLAAYLTRHKEITEPPADKVI